MYAIAQGLCGRRLLGLGGDPAAANSPSGERSPRREQPADQLRARGRTGSPGVLFVPALLYLMIFAHQRYGRLTQGSFDTVPVSLL